MHFDWLGWGKWSSILCLNITTVNATLQLNIYSLNCQVSQHRNAHQSRERRHDSWTKSGVLLLWTNWGCRLGPGPGASHAGLQRPVKCEVLLCQFSAMVPATFHLSCWWWGLFNFIESDGIWWLLFGCFKISWVLFRSDGISWGLFRSDWDRSGQVRSVVFGIYLVYLAGPGVMSYGCRVHVGLVEIQNFRFPVNLYSPSVWVWLFKQVRKEGRLEIGLWFERALYHLYCLETLK